MTAAELEELGIDPERASARAAFSTAYARLAEEDYVREARNTVAETESSRANALDAATAHREAAQWSLAMDADGAFDHLATAASWFTRLGLAYGDFLGAACRTVIADGPPRPDGDVIRQLRAAVAGTPVETYRFEPRDLALPQQQAYLFVAAAATPELAEEFREELEAIADLPAMGSGTAPVGALGLPVRTYVGAGQHSWITIAIPSCCVRSSLCPVDSTKRRGWRPPTAICGGMRARPSTSPISISSRWSPWESAGSKGSGTGSARRLLDSTDGRVFR
jgi:hypothetical protein